MVVLARPNEGERMWEITKSFKFESAHTLNRVVETEGSRRIHGHSYRAEVALRGSAERGSGMVADLGSVERALKHTKDALDHRFLDDVADLGPATMENLSKWIWDHIRPQFPQLVRVTIYRDSLGESAAYFGPESVQT